MTACLGLGALISISDYVWIVNVLTPGSPALGSAPVPSQAAMACIACTIGPASSQPHPSPDPPGGLDGNHMFKMLDCCCYEPEGLFGKGYSVKAVFIYTRAGVFLLCIITCFLMYRQHEPFFLSLVESQPGQGCV